MYKLEIQPKNENANAHFFNEWLKENYTIISSSYNNFGVDVCFSVEVSDLDKTTITGKYNSLIATDLIYSDIIKSNYEQRTIDGLDYFNDIRVGLVLQYQAQEITDLDIYDIEERLEKVIVKILRGDWLTASNEMNNVVVAGSLQQSFVDELDSYILNYIAQNY